MNPILRQRNFPSGQQLQLVEGDITWEHVDAIVNAANAHLMHGGGVAAVIARKGGPVIEQQSRAWVREHGPVTHDQPAYTEAGNLPCKYVIHAVGPVWGEGDEDARLAAAVRGSLQRADELKLATIAFPAISTGIFGFPKPRAAKIMFGAIEHYFRDYPSSGIALVRLTLFDRPTVDAFLQTWDALQHEA